VTSRTAGSKTWQIQQFQTLINFSAALLWLIIFLGPCIKIGILFITSSEQFQQTGTIILFVLWINNSFGFV
jgi:hypothetical protein